MAAVTAAAARIPHRVNRVRLIVSSWKNWLRSPVVDWKGNNIDRVVPLSDRAYQSRQCFPVPAPRSSALRESYLTDVRSQWWCDLPLTDRGCPGSRAPSLCRVRSLPHQKLTLADYYQLREHLRCSAFVH